MDALILNWFKVFEFVFLLPKLGFMLIVNLSFLKKSSFILLYLNWNPKNELENDSILFIIFFDKFSEDSEV